MKKIKHRLGGPAWLHVIANEKAEMNHAIPSMSEETRREDDREVLGLHDAAHRIERLERCLAESNLLFGEIITGKHRGGKEMTLCHRQIATNKEALE